MVVSSNLVATSDYTEFPQKDCSFLLTSCEIFWKCGNRLDRDVITLECLVQDPWVHTCLIYALLVYIKTINDNNKC